MLHLRCHLPEAGQWGFYVAVFRSADLKSTHYKFTYTEQTAGSMDCDIPLCLINVLYFVNEMH